MSLFKARELWSVDLNVPDAFDGNSLLVESVNCRACIFVGSHDGYLRVYSPSAPEPLPYNPSDLLYETMFPAPVLQMNMARLVSGTSGRQLAVLHPKALAVYLVQQADTEGESVLALRHVYQHALPRAAHSFVTGPFGRVHGRDFLVIQSLDGLLTFFEQEAPTFETQLPDFLLPGQFRYIPAVDAFVFQNANQYITCYTYEELSQTSRKILKPLWTHNIGGYVVDINCVTRDDQVSLVILTERDIYNLDEQGKIIWMKRFEFQPVCFYNFVNKITGLVMSVVCTESQAIHVYEGTCLKWCAKLDFVPVCVTQVDVGGLHGLLVLLSDAGLVQCVYLGTVPSLYLIPPTAEPDINVAEGEEELKKLQLQITDTDIGGAMDDMVTVKLAVDTKATQHAEHVFCSVSVEIKTLTPVNNIQVVFSVELPLVSSVESTVVPSLVNTETVVSQVSVAGEGVVSGLEVRVVVSYAMPNGAPRVVEQQGTLPFEVAMVTCPAVKDAPVKLTVATNKPTCALNELFPGEEGGPNALGLRFVNSASTVTIVAAKTSQRYRIQGETYEDLGLVLTTLVQRLHSHFRRVPDLSLTFAGPLPVQAYLNLIESLYELVTRKRLKQEQLAQRATQYRTIQKKVLASLKDLNPRPTGALYTVLGDTHTMMKTVMTELEALDRDLAACRGRLASLSRLLLALLRLMTLTVKDLEHLQFAFSPIIYHGDEQGWLEVQNATLTLLLRTAFAKSSKDQYKPGEMTLEPLSDVSRLCKLVTTVLDRATKGTSLMERAEFESERELLPTVPSVKEWEAKAEKLVPKSAKFIDLNVPNPKKLALPTRKLSNTPHVETKQEGIYVETEVVIETARNLENDVTADTEVTVAGTQVYPATPVTEKPTDSKSVAKPELTVEEASIWDITIDEMTI